MLCFASAMEAGREGGGTPDLFADSGGSDEDSDVAGNGDAYCSSDDDFVVLTQRPTQTQSAKKRQARQCVTPTRENANPNDSAFCEVRAEARACASTSESHHTRHGTGVDESMCETIIVSDDDDDARPRAAPCGGGVSQRFVCLF